MNIPNINCIYYTKDGRCISPRKYSSYGWVRRLVSNLLFQDRCTLLTTVCGECKFQEKYIRPWLPSLPKITPAPPSKTNNTINVHVHFDKDK